MEVAINEMAQFAVPWLLGMLGFLLFYHRFCAAGINKMLAISEISNIEIYGVPAHSTHGSPTRDLLLEMTANAKLWHRRHWLWLARHLVCMHILAAGTYLALALCMHALFGGDAVQLVFGGSVALVMLGGMARAWGTLVRVNRNRTRISQLIGELSRLIKPAGQPSLPAKVAALLPRNSRAPVWSGAAATAGWREFVRYADSSVVPLTRSANVFPQPSTHGR